MILLLLSSLKPQLSNKTQNSTTNCCKTTFSFYISTTSAIYNLHSLSSIVIMSLRNLALISRDELLFRRVLSKIVELFGSTRVVGKTSLLEHRGSLIIRHLCNLLKPEKGKNKRNGRIYQFRLYRSCVYKAY